MKTCNKKGEAEVHWTAGQLCLLQHLCVSDCMSLYHKMISNDFKPLKLYLIISNNKSGMAPLSSVSALNSCTVEHEPSLQVFGKGIPLLCWVSCLLNFFF